MTPRVVQIALSPGGLPKYPVASAEVTPLGLLGDGHRNTRVHGGPRQALLLVTLEAIDELKQLGYDLFPGALGENITTQGLDRRTLREGQRYRIGQQVIVELTKPRGPCLNLDVYGESLKNRIYDKQVKQRDPSSPLWGLSGFYCAVIEGGRIAAGDPLMLMDQTA